MSQGLPEPEAVARELAEFGKRLGTVLPALNAAGGARGRLLDEARSFLAG